MDFFRVEGTVCLTGDRGHIVRGTCVCVWGGCIVRGTGSDGKGIYRGLVGDFGFFAVCRSTQ